jgi:hypothetical protein
MHWERETAVPAANSLWAWPLGQRLQAPWKSVQGSVDRRCRWAARDDAAQREGFPTCHGAVSRFVGKEVEQMRETLEDGPAHDEYAA